MISKRGKGHNIRKTGKGPQSSKKNPKNLIILEKSFKTLLNTIRTHIMSGFANLIYLYQNDENHRKNAKLY